MAPYVIALLNIRMRNQRERNCEPRWTPIIGVVGEFSRRESPGGASSQPHLFYFVSR